MSMMCNGPSAPPGDSCLAVPLGVTDQDSTTGLRSSIRQTAAMSGWALPLWLCAPGCLASYG